MAARVLRPSIVPTAFPKSRIPRACAPHIQFPRHFIGNSLETSSKTIHASRTLEYPAMDIYNIIADIESYPKFLPYCLQAQVKTWSRRDQAHNREWPQSAELTAGWGEVRERFTSAVVCVPPTPSEHKGVVEAISGDCASAIKPEDAPHYDIREGEAPASTWSLTSLAGGAPLKFLRTRWTVEEGSSEPDHPRAQVGFLTQVTVEIEYLFANVLYEAMGKAVLPGLAERMVVAFEKRVGSLLEREALKKKGLTHRLTP